MADSADWVVWGVDLAAVADAWQAGQFLSPDGDRLCAGIGVLDGGAVRGVPAAGRGFVSVLRGDAAGAGGRFPAAVHVQAAPVRTDRRCADLVDCDGAQVAVGG